MPAGPGRHPDITGRNSIGAKRVRRVPLPRNSASAVTATASPSQTRCETYAANHRQSRRKAKERATWQKDQASGQTSFL